jgi:hypothetical protein
MEEQTKVSGGLQRQGNIKYIICTGTKYMYNVMSSDMKKRHYAYICMQASIHSKFPS